MAGLPIVVSNLFEMKRLVETYNIGRIVNQNTPDMIAKTLLSLDDENISKFKKNIEKAQKIFHWENQEKVLLEVYKSL